jgi:hypothetical protein
MNGKKLGFWKDVYVNHLKVQFRNLCAETGNSDRNLRQGSR